MLERKEPFIIYGTGGGGCVRNPMRGSEIFWKKKGGSNSSDLNPGGT